MQDNFLELKSRCKSENIKLKEVHLFLQKMYKKKISYKTFVNFLKNGDMKALKTVEMFFGNKKHKVTVGDVFRNLRLKSKEKRFRENISLYKLKKIEKAQNISEISPEVFVIYSKILGISISELRKKIIKEVKNESSIKSD